MQLKANYTDRNGVVMVVGSRCVLLTGDEAGTIVWVHRVGGSIPKRQIQVVDCHPSAGDVTSHDDWTVCAWVSPKDMTVVGGGGPC